MSNLRDGGLYGSLVVVSRSPEVLYECHGARYDSQEVLFHGVLSYVVDQMIVVDPFWLEMRWK